jgi:hypothetical protein
LKLFILFQTLFNFQAGDLIFQDCQCGPICEAIEDVNQLNDKRRFSHMAIVVKDNDTLKVVEANTNGVKMVNLDSFIARYKDKKGNPRIAVGRILPDYEYLIPIATEFSKNQIDKDYDYQFLPNNDKFYCSELIYEAFNYAYFGETPFFNQIKMTFKKYKSKETHPEFVKYYKKLKKPIPEGKLGTNPAQLSRDNRFKLTYLF